MFKRILVPVDGSRTSGHGLAEAVRLARSQDATLCLVHVLDMHMLLGYADAGAMAPITEEFLDALRRDGTRILERARAQATSSGVKSTTVLADNIKSSIADVILAQARKARADLIVMGTHGRRGISRLVLGSAAEGVVREAPVPVLLVRNAPRGQR
jgi:nucleotide-binding universal stress UspA family protein